ncbi:MAG: hypothetical protein RL681_593 [Candidatus Parcubacteria bacterium]|jgi:hypothetical protein
MGRPTYLEIIRERGKRSRIYRKYQLVGLEIAELLRDPAHTALYIKLAKDRNANELRELARSVANRKKVRNRGAYFMYLLSSSSPHTPARPVQRTRRKKPQ